MNTNLLSDLSMGEELLAQVKRNMHLVIVLLTLSAIYFVIELFNWYNFFSLPHNMLSIEHFFYYYRFVPLMGFIRISLTVSGYILNYRGYRYLMAGIENKDTEIFTKGFRIFNTTLIFGLILFAMIFTEMICHTLIIK